VDSIMKKVVNSAATVVPPWFHRKNPKERNLKVEGPKY
jgi:hypothetical protein